MIEVDLEVSVDILCGYEAGEGWKQPSTTALCLDAQSVCGGQSREQFIYKNDQLIFSSFLPSSTLATCQSVLNTHRQSLPNTSNFLKQHTFESSISTPNQPTIKMQFSVAIVAAFVAVASATTGYTNGTATSMAAPSGTGAMGTHAPAANSSIPFNNAAPIQTGSAMALLFAAGGAALVSSYLHTIE
jgi:hypothetical protein